MTPVEKRSGKNGVRIEIDRHGYVSLLTTRNGFQWSGCEVDRELLEMVHDSIRACLGLDREPAVGCIGCEIARQERDRLKIARQCGTCGTYFTPPASTQETAVKQPPCHCGHARGVHKNVSDECSLCQCDRFVEADLSHL